MSTLKVTNIQHGSATNVAMVLDTAGTVKAYSTISVGNVTPSSSGAGITFPATASASSDANTLDDYEEGTWTPTLAFGGGSTGITYTARRVGFYTKIGRLVTVNFFLSPSNIGSSTGTATITGLPFQAANNNQAAVGGCMLNVISNSGNTVATIDTNASIVDFYTTTTAGTRSQLSNTNFSNNCEVAATISYLV